MQGESSAPRIARPADIEAITRTIALAFSGDPVWGPAFGGARTTLQDEASIWRVMISAAVRYPWSAIVDDGAAVSIWIPPDGIEMNEPEEHELEGLLTDRLGLAGAAQCLALFARFEENHSRETPHAYLSLLATHPDHRGRGIGMALLADDLRRVDEAHLPAWLESTNPVNDRRYQALGFEPAGSFRTIDQERVITTMWRPAR